MSLPVLLPLVAPLQAEERFSLVGVSALRGQNLEVRLLWLPQSGWLPEGGFALYRRKGEGPLVKLLTRKPDPVLLPVALQAKATVAATLPTFRGGARAQSSLSAFQALKSTAEQLHQQNVPTAKVQQQVGNLPGVKSLDPVRTGAKRPAPTAAEQAEALRSQIALVALTDRDKAKALALGFDDAEVQEGDTLQYVLKGVDASGAEQALPLATFRVTVRRADTAPPPPDATSFSAVQLDQDSALLHWEAPTDTELDRLVLPTYTVTLSEQKRNQTPILLTSHATSSTTHAASLTSFQDDKVPLGSQTWKLTLTDAFGRVSAPVSTTLTMKDLRIPRPVGAVLARYELDRRGLAKGGALTPQVRLIWAAPEDSRPVHFDLWRTDPDVPNSRTALTATSPLAGDPMGNGTLTVGELVAVTSQRGFVDKAVSNPTASQRAQLFALKVGDFLAQYPAAQAEVATLTARLRTTVNAAPTPDHYFRYEVAACYPENRRDSVSQISASVGVPLTTPPSAPTGTSGNWSKNANFSSGSLTSTGTLRDTLPALAQGAFVSRKTLVKKVGKKEPLKPLAAKLGGAVALQWSGVPQTANMRYRVYRACATGFFTTVDLNVLPAGNGRRIGAGSGKLVRRYFTQFNSLKDTDYVLLGSTATTQWSDPLPPSQRCVYLYKIEPVNRWGVAGTKSAPITVTVAATLPPSTPVLASVKPQTLENVDGALKLTFAPNATEERVTEYKILRYAVPVTKQVTLAAPRTTVASTGQPPASGTIKPRLSSQLGTKQLAPQGPEAQRIGFPSARFGVTRTSSALQAISQLKLPQQEVLRRLTSYATIGTVTVPVGTNPASLSYLDTTAKPGTEYAYRLLAINDDGIGSPGSNFVDGRPFTKTLKPSKGTIAWDAASASVSLNWDSVAGAGGYFVRRQQGSGPLLQLAALGGAKPATTFQDPDVRTGKSYQYFVYASDTEGGLSDPLVLSVSVPVEAGTLPARPNGSPTPAVPTTAPPSAPSESAAFGKPYFLDKEKTWAITVQKAEYSIEPFVYGSATKDPALWYCKPDQKFVKVTLQVQNVGKDVQHFGYQSISGFGIGADGNHGPTTDRWKRLDNGALADMTMPMGQTALLQSVVTVPAEGAALKLTLGENTFPLGDTNPVVRLPKGLTADGITVLPETPARKGVAYPGNRMRATLVSTELSSAKFGESELEEGKVYFVATVMVQNQAVDETAVEYQMLYLTLYDADGEKYEMQHPYKATSGDPAKGVLGPVGSESSERTLRFVVAVPKTALFKKLTLSQYDSRVYVYTQGNF